MAENTDEEHLDNTSIPLSENPPDEIIPANTTETINLNQETENMEIHAHDLHKAPGHGWKHYLFEFLMLFLAVFCGFLAENLRENIKEHESAKVYAASMMNDLKEDTTQLKSYLSYVTYASGKVDTFLQMVTYDNVKNIPSGKLYWYGLFGGAENTFTPNDATFQQMKSSGLLRYFTNTILAQEVAKYDRLCRQMQTRQEGDHNLSLEVRKYRAQIFEFKYNMQANDIYQSNKILFSQQKIDSFIVSNPPLLSYDKIIFNQYAEMVRSRFYKNNVNVASLLLNNADTLIAELKKEYHLKN